MSAANQATREIAIPLTTGAVSGDLAVPPAARGIVIFAHGSGSSRFSSRNQYVAGELQRAGLGTLLMDLLTTAEESVDLHTREHRFDIELLAGRVQLATGWIADQKELAPLLIGYFGASTGAAAALVAAAHRPHIAAVVSRGGRPDLAGDALPEVKAPTVLIVGGRDVEVLELNRQAAARMRCETRIEVVPGASHLFEEPGTLEQAAHLARDWFLRHLSGAGSRAA